MGLLLVLIFLIPHCSSADSGFRILGRCQELLQKSNIDVKDRGILNFFEKDCTQQTSDQLKSLEEIEKIADTLNYQRAVDNINLNSFKQSLKAFLVEEIKFGRSELPFGSSQELQKAIFKRYPKIQYEPRFMRVFFETYKELETSNQEGFLYRINKASAVQQFNQYSSELERNCKKIREIYKNKFEGMSFMQKGFVNNIEYAQFIDEAKKIIYPGLQKITEKTVLGHYLSTPHFRSEIFNPRDSYLDKCAKENNYVIMKPISLKDLEKGHTQIKEAMNENMSISSWRNESIERGDVITMRRSLEGMLKSDPEIINQTLYSLPLDEQKKLAAAICLETHAIYSTDRAFKVGEIAFNSAAIISSAVIASSGIGAPAGVSLMSTLLRGATGTAEGFSTGVKLVNYIESMSSDRGNNLSLMEKRKDLRSYLIEHKKNIDVREGIVADIGLKTMKNTFDGVKVYAENARPTSIRVLARPAEVISTGIEKYENMNSGVETGLGVVNEIARPPKE